MEIILFTGVAIVLYLVSDHILLFLERVNGGVLPYRSVIFFIIIMILSLITFDIMEGVLKSTSSGPDGSFPTLPDEFPRTNEIPVPGPLGNNGG